MSTAARVLITGGSGFIGSAIAARVSGAGHHVRVMDLVGCSRPGIEFVRGDITCAADCVTACAGMDIVIHGAGIHQADQVNASVSRMIGVNVSGTVNVLNGAIKGGARRFVYLSTGKVYGDALSLPSSEDDLPRPLEAYALAKIAAEDCCRRIQASCGMDMAVIRPFSVYGPGQDLDTGYVGVLLRAAAGENPPSLPAGDGCTRDFVHVSDVARLAAGAALGRLPGYTVLNAGSGQATPLTRLVALAEDVLGRQLDLHWTRPRASTILHTHASMETAQRLLGFRPEISLSAGLAETFAWFLQDHPAPQPGVAT